MQGGDLDQATDVTTAARGPADLWEGWMDELCGMCGKVKGKECEGMRYKEYREWRREGKWLTN